MGIFEAGPLGLAGSGNVERIGIVLSKPNHTKSLKNQWRATYAPGYLAAGSLFTRLAEREGFDCGLFPYRLVCKEIAKIPANMGILPHAHCHHMSQMLLRLTKFLHFWN